MSQDLNARRRTTLKSTHILGLEAKFMEDSRPSNQVRAELAKSLNLNERTVQIWFQNRRTKARASGAMPKACFRKPKSATSTTTTNNKEPSDGEHSPLSAPSDPTTFTSHHSLNFNLPTTTSTYDDLPSHFPTKTYSYPPLPLDNYPTHHSYPIDSPHHPGLSMDLFHDPYQLSMEPHSTATQHADYPMHLLYPYDLPHHQHHQHALPMDLMFHHSPSPSFFNTHPYPHLH